MRKFFNLPASRGRGGALATPKVLKADNGDGTQTFTVDPAGSSRQWRINGTNVSGATGNPQTLTVGAGDVVSCVVVPLAQTVEVTIGAAAALPGVDSLWVGAASASSITATAQVETPGTVRFAVSENSVMSGAVFSDPVQADASYRLARATVSGLDPATDYFVEIEVDGALTGRRGTFRTDGPGAFSMCLASCADTGSNHPIFDTIRAEGADLFFHMGDMHYEDITVADESLFQAAYDTVFSQPRQAQLYASTATYLVLDDHDAGGGNNSDSNDPAMAAATAAYRRRVPSAPLVETNGALYSTFDRGPVRFAVLDVRSNRVAGDLLGAAQEAWLINLIETLPVGKVLGIVSASVWVASTGADTWADAPAQRTRIANAITASAQGRAFVMSGDMHALAFDNGTNSEGGMPVVQAAPLDRSNSTKGGPFTTPPITASQNQYGRLDVTPTANGASIRFRGYSVDGAGAKTLRVDRTFALEPATVAEPFGAFVQGRSGQEDGNESDTSATLVLPAPATAGNLLVFAGGPDKGFSNPQAPSGFSTAVAEIGGSGETALVYYKVAVGGEQSIRLSWSGPARWGAVLAEYKGPFATPALGESSVNRSGSNTTSLSTGGTGLLAQADNLIVGFAFKESAGSNADPITASGGMSQDVRTGTPPNGGTPAVALFSKVVSDTASQDIAFTFGGNADAVAVWAGAYRRQAQIA